MSAEAKVKWGKKLQNYPINESHKLKDPRTMSVELRNWDTCSRYINLGGLKNLGPNAQWVRRTGMGSRQFWGMVEEISFVGVLHFLFSYSFIEFSNFSQTHRKPDDDTIKTDIGVQSMRKIVGVFDNVQSLCSTLDWPKIDLWLICVNVQGLTFPTFSTEERIDAFCRRPNLSQWSWAYIFSWRFYLFSAYFNGLLKASHSLGVDCKFLFADPAGRLCVLDAIIKSKVFRFFGVLGA